MEDKDVMELFSRRERECQLRARALELWLATLTPLRWGTVIGTTILSAIAGAAVLSKAVKHWDIIGGVCALLAAVLSGLHAGLKCDAHQSECRRLIQVYEGLKDTYEAARLSPPTDLMTRQAQLEEKFGDATKNAAAAAPNHYRRRAEQE